MFLLLVSSFSCFIQLFSTTNVYCIIFGDSLTHTRSLPPFNQQLTILLRHYCQRAATVSYPSMTSPIVLLQIKYISSLFLSKNVSPLPISIQKCLASIYLHTKYLASINPFTKCLQRLHLSHQTRGASPWACGCTQPAGHSVLEAFSNAITLSSHDGEVVEVCGASSPLSLKFASSLHLLTSSWYWYWSSILGFRQCWRGWRRWYWRGWRWCWPS